MEAIDPCPSRSTCLIMTLRQDFISACGMEQQELSAASEMLEDVAAPAVIGPRPPWSSSEIINSQQELVAARTRRLSELQQSSRTEFDVWRDALGSICLECPQRRPIS